MEQMELKVSEASRHTSPRQGASMEDLNTQFHNLSLEEESSTASNSSALAQILRAQFRKYAEKRVQVQHMEGNILHLKQLDLLIGILREVYIKHSKRTLDAKAERRLIEEVKHHIGEYEAWTGAHDSEVRMLSSGPGAGGNGSSGVNYVGGEMVPGKEHDEGSPTKRRKIQDDQAPTQKPPRLLQCMRS